MGNELEEIRKKMNVDEAHMLVPTVYIGKTNPLYSISAIKVQVDTKTESSEIFKVGSTKRGGNFIDLYALGKPALEKFAAAAGISINSCNSYTRMLDENTFVGHVEAALLTPDGSPRLMTNEKTINMAVVEKSTYEGKKKAAEYGFSGKTANQLAALYKGEWRQVTFGKEKDNKFFIAEEDMKQYLKAATEEAMVQQWKDAPQKAWTGAWLRLIRSALNMRPTYTMAELSRPFVITRLNFKPDYSDPLVRRMALEQGFRSMGMMYGGNQQSSIPASYTEIPQQPSVNNESSPAAPEQKSSTGKPDEPDIKNQQGSKGNAEKHEHICADCGNKIVPSKAGVNLDEKCKNSRITFGRELCPKCMKAEMKAPKNIIVCDECHKKQDITPYLKKPNSSMAAILKEMNKVYGCNLCSDCMRKRKKTA